MTISGYDCWKMKDFSRRRKLESVGAETTSSGSSFQIRGPETLKVRLPTVDSRNIGTTRRLELTERSAARQLRQYLTLTLLTLGTIRRVTKSLGYETSCTHSFVAFGGQLYVLGVC